VRGAEAGSEQRQQWRQQHVHQAESIVGQCHSSGSGGKVEIILNLHTNTQKNLVGKWELGGGNRQ